MKMRYTQRRDLIIGKVQPTFHINKRHNEFRRRVDLYNRDINRYQMDLELLCSLLDIRRGMKILEIGGGVGITSLELANLGATCYDLDICPGNAEFVTHIAAFHRLDIHALRGDTCHLPFSDNSFDALYSKDTFEHIWDVDLALREQLRVLKRGGRLCILVGNLLNPRTFSELFFKKLLASGGRNGGFKWLFTKSRSYGDFGIGWHGKDEDIKSIWWWKRTLASTPGLRITELTTTRAYKHPDRLLYRLLRPFVGGHVICAVKE